MQFSGDDSAIRDPRRTLCRFVERSATERAWLRIVVEKRAAIWYLRSVVFLHLRVSSTFVAFVIQTWEERTRQDRRATGIDTLSSSASRESANCAMRNDMAAKGARQDREENDGVPSRDSSLGRRNLPCHDQTRARMCASNPLFLCSRV